MKYTEEHNGITVTGGFDDRTVIELPPEINSKKVTAVGKYAFADRNDIREVIFPEGITHIGAHAFYNCKNIELIELHDNIRDIDDGAFKNCYRLSRIIMHSHSGREGCIRNLMDDNTQELYMHIFYDNGKESELTFPVFEDDYVENTPARIFQAVSYGTGGAYRQCMQVGSIDYRDFDRLFPRSVREDRFQAALYNSIGRLMYPYRLYDSAKKEYAEFLRDNAGKAAEILIEEKNTDGIKVMCDCDAFDEGSVSAAVTIAAQKGMPDVVGILMSYKAEHFKPVRKTFEL